VGRNDAHNKLYKIFLIPWINESPLKNDKYEKDTSISDPRAWRAHRNDLRFLQQRNNPDGAARRNPIPLYQKIPTQ
jgi:hypothetical protein